MADRYWMISNRKPVTKGGKRKLGRDEGPLRYYVWNRKNRPLLLSLINQLVLMAADVDNHLSLHLLINLRLDPKMSNVGYQRMLRLVALDEVQRITSGRLTTTIALIDGCIDPAELPRATLRVIGDSCGGRSTSFSNAHGTSVAKLLVGGNGWGVCPGCSLLVRPIFVGRAEGGTPMPASTPDVLAAAIGECVAAGADVLNLSVGVSPASPQAFKELVAALDYAGRRGVIVVAAAGNQGLVGSTVLTGHPSVIPVGACDGRGVPLGFTNLGATIGRRGLLAPGHLPRAGSSLPLVGTSFAAPLVAGAAALLKSAFEDITMSAVRSALLRTARGQRRTVIPPLMNAGAAFRLLAAV